MEDETPHVERTMQFRKSERAVTPIWQEKLDKVGFK